MLKYTNFIGYGIVGESCHRAFEHNTEAVIIDPQYNSNTIQSIDIHKAHLTFVSINAPTLADGSVDASVIYSIFQQLADIDYKGIVVLKSTLPPDTVYDLYVKYASDTINNKVGPLRYIYSPEFIREKHWQLDAISPAFMILAGEYRDCKDLETLYRNHSQISTYCRFHLTDYKSAALVKYSINSYLATKVVFMNQLYQLYHDMHNSGIGELHSTGWDEFTRMLALDLRLGNSHFDVPGLDKNYGYGGSCFPKDIKAMIGFDGNERLTLIREADLVNTKIRLTGTKE
jgi:UDPglucose 6-dehydrogenase